MNGLVREIEAFQPDFIVVDLENPRPRQAGAVLPGHAHRAAADDLLSYRDAGASRFAAFDGETLHGALWITPGPVAVSRAWATAQLGETHGLSRLQILAGRGGADRPDSGAIVCSCFSVGAKDIRAAVSSGRCRGVAEIGTVLQAGTNCGSCRSEIQGIIDDSAVLDAA